MKNLKQTIKEEEKDNVNHKNLKKFLEGIEPQDVISGSKGKFNSNIHKNNPC